MKKTLGVAAAVALVGLLALSARAQNFGGVGLRLNINGAMQVDSISKAVTLTEEQQAKLKTIAEKVEADLKESQQQYLNAVKALQQPRNDPAAAQELNKKRIEASQQMQTQRQTLLAKSLADMEAVLTPEQRSDWQGYVLQQTMMMRLRVAGALSEEQQAQFDKLTKAAAKDFAALKDPADEAAKNAIQGKLWKQVVAFLTDEQLTRVMGGTGGATSGMGIMIQGGGMIFDNGVNVMPLPAPVPVQAKKDAAGGVIVIHGDDAPNSLKK